MSSVPAARLDAAPDAAAAGLAPDEPGAPLALPTADALRPAVVVHPEGAARPEVAHDAKCRNCDARMHGPYCAQCGQHVPHGNPTLHDVLHDATHELLHVDGRLTQTVRDLLLRPGRLTREFLDGRRARYVSPLRLYLTCSVLFFFIATATPSTSDIGIVTVAEDTPSGRVYRAPNAAEQDSFVVMLERKAERVGGVRAVGLRGLARFQRDPASAQRAMVSAMPKIMFVLVPFFALVTMLVYRRRGLHYPSHLYFALHVFAFYFTVSAVGRLARFTRVPEVATLATLAAALVTVGYLAIAMRRVYGGRASATALRLASLLAVFGVGFLIVVSIAAVIVLGFATP